MKLRCVLICGLALSATLHAQTPPANCNTAGGSPCLRNTWNVASAASTPTFTGTGGAQSSGPVLVGVLRCKGVCLSSTLPPISPNGAALVGNSTWIVVSQGVSQSTTSGVYFDTGLSYNTTYTYALTATYVASQTIPGGGWGAYSSTFQGQIGQAPQVGPVGGVPATPDTGTSTPQ